MVIHGIPWCSLVWHQCLRQWCAASAAIPTYHQLIHCDIVWHKGKWIYVVFLVICSQWFNRTKHPITENLSPKCSQCTGTRLVKSLQTSGIHPPPSQGKQVEWHQHAEYQTIVGEWLGSPFRCSEDNVPRSKIRCTWPIFCRLWPNCDSGCCLNPIWHTLIQGKLNARRAQHYAVFLQVNLM